MPVHLEEHICVRVNAYKQIVWVNRSPHNWPWFLTLYPKIARNSPTPRRARLCEHQRTAVAQLSAITDNQERSERFRSARNRKSHLGFEVQKQVSSGEKFKSNVPFLTEQFPAPVQGIQISVIIPDTTNQFFLLFVMFPQWERDYVRQQRLQKNGREVQREGEWTGNRERNGVFLWADFKWQCNRCPTKGWPSLIRLDFGDKSALLLTMSKSLRPPIFFLMSGWCGRMG